MSAVDFLLSFKLIRRKAPRQDPPYHTPGHSLFHCLCAVSTLFLKVGGGGEGIVKLTRYGVCCVCLQERNKGASAEQRASMAARYAFMRDDRGRPDRTPQDGLDREKRSPSGINDMEPGELVDVCCRTYLSITSTSHKHFTPSSFPVRADGCC